MVTPVSPPQPASFSLWHDTAVRPNFTSDRSESDEFDVVVIGGGVAGCSTAFHLAKVGIDVALCEAREVASGASGRNGGFLLAGLAHRFTALCKITGRSRAAALYRLTQVGLDELFSLAEQIGAEQYVTRIGSLRLAVDENEVLELHKEADLMRACGLSVEALTADELPNKLGAKFLYGLRFPTDGRSHPAGWVYALAQAAFELGVKFFEHSPVADVSYTANHPVTIKINDGQVIQAGRVVVCTDAWLPGLLPEFEAYISPYRSQVLAARVKDALLDHVTWSRRGWDYIQQTADGVLVIGGEKREDFERLKHWNEDLETEDQCWLEQWLLSTFKQEPQVLKRWAGVLSQTLDGFPYLGELKDRPNVHVCGGWGGAGNVLGFLGGRLLAESIINKNEDGIPVEMRAHRI